MDWEAVREWILENWRLALGGILLLIFCGSSYYFIRQVFSDRQVRLEAVSAIELKDWSADPPAVVGVLNTTSPLLLPREIIPRLLQKKVERISDYGPDVKSEQYKIPPVSRRKAPDLIGNF